MTVEEEDNSYVVLKDSLRLEFNFRYVPAKAWASLHKWYGGGPTIARRCIKLAYDRESIELQPLLLKVRVRSLHTCMTQ